MVSLIQNINPWVFRGLFVVSLIAVGLIGRSLRGQAQKLEGSGYSNLAFELTFSARVAEDILRVWEEKNLVETAKALTRRDYWFIPAYAFAFASATLLVMRGIQPGFLLSAGLIFVAAPLVAGLLDVIENSFLLSMLKSVPGISSKAALTASWAAMFKFVLLGETVLYWLIGISASLLRLFRP